jgi:hypothetical protein
MGGGSVVRAFSGDPAADPTSDNPADPPSDPPSGPGSVPGSVPAESPHRLVRAFYWIRSKVTRPPDQRPYILGELVVVLCLLRLYDFVRVRAHLRESHALQSARDLFNLEKWLQIDFELSFNHWTVDHRWFNYAASYWYQFSHISVAMAVLVWCWWKRPLAYRAFRNAIVMIKIAGLTIFLLFPVAPPRLLPGAGFIDADRLVGFGSNDVGPVTADQFGAFPSLHIAWAVWVAVLMFTLTRNRRLARIWICYPFVTLIAIVATGNHFVLDAVAGAILALAALKVALHRWDRETA